MVPVYYCPGRPYTTILSRDLKCYVGFQKVAYKLLEHFDFFYHQGNSYRSPYQTRKILEVRHVVSRLDVCIPEKPLTPNNIGGALKGPQRQF